MKKLNEKIAELLLYTCAWCGKELNEDEPVFSVLLKPFADNVDVTKNRGCFIPFPAEIADNIIKVIPGFVPLENSEAHMEGTQIVFAACSEICRKEITKAVTVKWEAKA